MKVFVVWDHTTPSLTKTLDSLKRRPPADVLFDVPMLAPAAGEVLRDVVVPGILDADRVLVVVDKPNANVGFETGLALGLGRKVALLVQRSPRPSWLSQPPFSNLMVQSIDGASAIKRLLEQNIWQSITDRQEEEPDPPPSPESTLFLCPSRYEGQSLEEEQHALFPGWRRVPDFSFNFHDLAALTLGVERLIWTVAHFGEGADERDGGENAANGVIAGWFFATILLRHRCELRRAAMDELRQRFHVLRSSEARPIADVQMFERTFRSLDDYAALLSGVPLPRVTATAPSTRQSSALARLQTLLNASLTAGGIVDAASSLLTAAALVTAVAARAPDKAAMVAALLDALGAPDSLNSTLLDRIAVKLPGSSREIEQLKFTLAGSEQTAAREVPTASPATSATRRITLGSVLGTAHRLDRTAQWGEVLTQCMSGDHSYFLLRGESRQGLGLFIERLNFYLTETIRNHRVYNVPFQIELEKAESGADWERRISHALAPRKQGTAATHLADACRSVSVFLVLGLRPLHDLSEAQEAGLKEFLSSTYPKLLTSANLSNPAHLLVPIDYDAGDDRLAETVDAAALQGEVHHNQFVRTHNDPRGGSRSTSRHLKYVQLKPVTFPTWDEVQEYLWSLRPRPTSATIAKIQLDFTKITSMDGSTFGQLAERLDRHLGDI
jgi:hypothetical protein